MSEKFRLLISYDNSKFADAAIEDLRFAGLADQDAWEAGDDGETEPPAALAPADYQGLFGAE